VEDINNTVLERLKVLIQQLQSLPLQNGNTKDVAAKLFNSLYAKKKDSVLD
jgi:hypothetical protein